MKKNIFYFVVLISLNSCLVLPLAPRTDYYKPIGEYQKIRYKNFKNRYGFYYINDNDSLKIYSALIVGSLPKEKIIYYDIKLVNNYSKNILFFSDSITFNIKSLNKIKFSNSKKNKIDIAPNDSVKISYVSNPINMSDWKWYRRFKKKDTINIKIKTNTKVIIQSYYFNYKNGSETYPF